VGDRVIGASGDLVIGKAQKRTAEELEIGTRRERRKAKAHRGSTLMTLIGQKRTA
jgi:hypothetical protein